MCWVVGHGRMCLQAHDCVQLPQGGFTMSGLTNHARGSDVRYVPAACAAVVQAGVPCGSVCLHSLLGHAETPEHAAACCVYMPPLVAGPYAGSH